MTRSAPRSLASWSFSSVMSIAATVPPKILAYCRARWPEAADAGDGDQVAGAHVADLDGLVGGDARAGQRRGVDAGRCRPGPARRRPPRRGSTRRSRRRPSSRCSAASGTASPSRSGSARRCRTRSPARARRPAARAAGWSRPRRPRARCRRPRGRARTAGAGLTGQSPCAAWMSVWHRPDASIRTTTWPGPGSGIRPLLDDQGRAELADYCGSHAFSFGDLPGRWSDCRPGPDSARPAVGGHRWPARSSGARSAGAPGSAAGCPAGRG